MGNSFWMDLNGELKVLIDKVIGDQSYLFELIFSDTNLNVF
jgi:hypothetical protein